ncbi:flippase [Bacillus sp. 1P10SD]|uniref:flippase n=1 Tax=Bacillus sp. 1P10SD TaxID=3132265 RepID=UPI0039A50053
MANVKQKSIRKNFLWNTSLRILNIIFPLITFPYIARVLSPQGIGKVDFSMSVIQYFILIAQVGIPMYAIRECAKYREDKEKLSKTVQEILLINSVMVIISFTLFSITILNVGSLSNYKTLLVIMSINIITTCLGIEWFYQAIEEYRLITIRSVLVKFLSLIFVFALIKDDSDYILYGIILVLSVSLGYLYNFIHLNKYIKLFKRNSEYNFKKHIRPILVLFAMSLSISIYVELDKVMLGIIVGDESVGFYTAASKIVKVVLALVTSLGVVLLPRMSYYIENNMNEEVNRLIKKSLDFILLISIPSTIGIIMLSEPIIILFAGKEFLPASSTIMIIAPTIIAIGLSNLIGVQILISYGKEKITVLSTIVGAIVNFTLNMLLISKFKQDGAAVGTLIAEFTVLFVQIYFSINIIKENVNFKSIFHYLIGSILIGLTCLLFNHLISHLLIRTVFSISFSLCIYFFTLYILRNKIVYELANEIIKKYFKKFA